MRYWLDLPLAQWIYIQEDKYHRHPYAVMIGGYVRARYTTKSEANDLVKRIYSAFEEK